MAGRIRIRIRWRIHIRVRVTRGTSMIGAAVLFVGLMVAMKPSTSSPRPDSRSDATPTRSSTGTVRLPRPSLHHLPRRKSSPDSGSATCQLVEAAGGKVEVSIRATNVGRSETSLRVLVNFRDSDGHLQGNDVAVFRHLLAHRTAQSTLPSPGSRLSTCEVAAVSYF